MLTSITIKKELMSLSNKEKAKASAWFFKTGIGQYGEGDIFLGITMPEQRNIAKKYLDLPFTEIQKLLHSKEHEYRMTAILILVEKYKRAKKRKDLKLQKQIYTLYLKNTKWINNWDLVDVSAEYIVGDYLYGQQDKMKTLEKLANSKNL